MANELSASELAMLAGFMGESTDVTAIPLPAAPIKEKIMKNEVSFETGALITPVVVAPVVEAPVAEAKPAATKVTSVEWFDPEIAKLRSSMFLADPMKRLGAKIRFVTKLEGPAQGAVMHVPWLYENFIQSARGIARWDIGTESYFARTPEGAHVLIHNYVENARLVMKWHWETLYKGVAQKHLGYNVFKLGFTDGVVDPTLREQHPMVRTLHNVAAYQRARPAVYGESKVFSLCAVNKYAVLAALLVPEVEIVMEVPSNFDWKATLEKGYQQELRVLSGEWAQENKGPTTSDIMKSETVSFF